MNRKKFIGIAGASVAVAGGFGYLVSDKHYFVRADIKEHKSTFPFKHDEKEILYLASLAPSGHNTQPWLIQYIEPYHWIINNDNTRWLHAVDPTQRETILSVGAFMQNLEYAANSFGYECVFTILAKTNQDKAIAEVKLTKAANLPVFDIEKIKLRRTVRSDYMKGVIKQDDVHFLTANENNHFHFFPNTSKEYNWLNEQTIEANRVQGYRDDAQQELSDWIRFSPNEAEKNLDGLTVASMEINGIPGWFVQNFYTKKDILKTSFREQGIDKVVTQVSSSGGWFLITSKDYSTNSLIDTGRKFQRILLKLRERNIAIHPMTQILEENSFARSVNSSVGITDPVQFIVRAGYIKNYPQPVSLRRPVEQFILP